MKNLDWLSPGNIFPPMEEAKRIGAYIDYDLMFDGDFYNVEEKHFKETLSNLNKIALKLGWTDSYCAVDYNYPQLISKKTADFICNAAPDILSGTADENGENPVQDEINTIRKKSKFDVKDTDVWIDVSRYGKCIIRVYGREGNDGVYGNFTIIHPGMVYKITDPEDDYETTAYAICYMDDDGTKLKAQIHYRGYYDEFLFAIKSAKNNELIYSTRYESANVPNNNSDMYFLVRDRVTGEIFRYDPYKITKLLQEKRGIKTGLSDFAILEIENIRSSDKQNGISDYEAVAPIVSSIQRTATQAQMVFDKFVIPTLVGPSELTNKYDAVHNQYFDDTESLMELGAFLGIPEDGTIPQFLEPDLTKLQTLFMQIDLNLKMLKEISEMGAAISSDDNVSGISTETMGARFQSIKSKSARLVTRNTSNFKKLFSLMSEIHGKKINEEDITIKWYDGLPQDEMKEVNIAMTLIQNGLSSRREQYTTRFEHTDEQFDQMWQDLQSENAELNAVSSILNPFGGTGTENQNAESANESETETEEQKPESEDETI